MVRGADSAGVPQRAHHSGTAKYTTASHLLTTIPSYAMAGALFVAVGTMPVCCAWSRWTGRIFSRGGGGVDTSFFGVFYSYSRGAFLPFRCCARASQSDGRFRFLPHGCCHTFFCHKLLFSSCRDPLCLCEEGAVFSKNSYGGGVLLRRPIRIDLLFHRLRLFCFFRTTATLVQ